MTLAAIIASDITDVFLVVADFAETFLRYAKGDKDNATIVVGIFTQQPTVVADNQRGKGYVRRGELLIKSTITAHHSDAWKIGDARYEVESIDEPQYGSRVVRLVHYEADIKGARKVGDI